MFYGTEEDPEHQTKALSDSELHNESRRKKNPPLCNSHGCPGNLLCSGHGYNEQEEDCVFIYLSWTLIHLEEISEVLGYSETAVNVTFFSK